MALPFKKVMVAIAFLTTAPLLTYADKPTVPTICSASNKELCECGDNGIVTYVWWIPGDHQRCIHTYNLSSTQSPRPVLISVSGYGQGTIGSTIKNRASYYNYAAIGVGSTVKDGAGGFGLEFPNNGVANASNPTPCSAADSRDHAYLLDLLDFIRDHANLDADRVYIEGFSQNSMFAAYMGVCFADRVAGLWQGGSGLAKTGYTPIVPGKQAQCTFSNTMEHGGDCCKVDFCEECTWWPVYPRTCDHKIIDCIAAYTNDKIACGSDWYMYNAMVAEGNDARLLSFSPSNGINGGHQNPQNKYDWMVGCLGIAESCTEGCEDRFLDCTQNGSLEDCAEDLENGNWEECNQGCAYTLEMLKRSETPVVTLSQGKFGTQTNLPIAGDTAPKPDCDFGTFDEMDNNQCATGAGPPEPAPIESCGPVAPTTPAPTRSPNTGAPVTPTTPAPTSANPPCGSSCEAEWPRCIAYHENRGNDGCDKCFQELQTPGSALVNKGDCVVGCGLTVGMKEVCGDFDTDEPTARSTPSPTIAPTDEPTARSTPSPTLAPTEVPCTQKKGDEFLYKIKSNGDETIKNCKWLDKQKAKKKKNTCDKKVQHGTGEVTNPAQDVCQASCESCGACYENPRSRFFTGTIKDGKPVHMTCKTLKKKGKNKKKEYCKMTAVNIYEPAVEVCRKTCGVESCSHSAAIFLKEYP